MICPACNAHLTKVRIEGIELDVCKESCGGIWFDRFELQKMDELHEFTDENLIDQLSVESPVKTDQDRRYHCPKCNDIVMMRHFWSINKQVEIDHCPNCAGYWLDEGELFRIRNQFKSEEERREAAMLYFAALFDGELANMRQESEERAEHARKIARMFRLISPRHYFSKTKYPS